MLFSPCDNLYMNANQARSAAIHILLRDPNISEEYRNALSLSTAFQPTLPLMGGFFRFPVDYNAGKVESTPGPVTGAYSERGYDGWRA